MIADPDSGTDSYFKFKFRHAMLWTAAYFVVMLFYTFLDIAVWRKIFPDDSEWVNIIVILLCVCGFIWLLKKRTKIVILSNITPKGIGFALLCAVTFFLLLDQCLDPVFENLFPQSEQDYQETIQSFVKSPMTGLLQVCIIAPVVEEVLMRGVILGKLKNTYGIPAALFCSALLFAVLHFNMVQTLSAFVCGIILGLLYLKTDSVPCCMLAHSVYNFISYVAIIYPLIRK